MVKQTNVTPVDPKEAQTMFSNELGEMTPTAVSVDADEAQGMFFNGLDKVDVGFHTNLRLLGILADLIANQSNKSNDNPNNFYNRTIHGGERHGGFTTMEWTLGLLFVVPFIIGVAIRYYEIRQKRWLDSYQRLQEQIDMIEVPGQADTTAQKMENMKRGFCDLISRDKVTYARYTPPEPETPPTTMQKVGSAASYGAGVFWRESTHAALIFWLVWAVAALFTSFVAASTVVSGGILPLVMAATGGIYLAVIGGLEIVKRIQQRRAYQQLTNDNKTAEQRKFEVEQHETNSYKLRQRLFMKREHAAILTNLAIKREARDKTARNNTTLTLDVDKDAITTLRERLLGSAQEESWYARAKTISNWFSSYTLTFFIVWLYSSIIMGVLGLVAAGAWLMDTAAGVAISATVGSFLAWKGSNALKAQLDKNRQDVDETLKKEITYRDVDGQYKRGTQAAFFVSYEKKLNELKQTIQAAQHSTNDKTSPIHQFDLSKIDVNNTRYFDQQEYLASRFARVKRAINYAYNAMGAFQSFVFIARSLFLAGAVAGGITFLSAGGWVPFVVIASVIGVAGLGLRMYLLHTEAKRAERANMAENLELRISWMKKKIKEMNAVISMAAPIDTPGEGKAKALATSSNPAQAGTTATPGSASLTEAEGSGAIPLAPIPSITTRSQDALETTPISKNALALFGNQRYLPLPESSTREILTVPACA